MTAATANGNGTAAPPANIVEVGTAVDAAAPPAGDERPLTSDEIRAIVDAYRPHFEAERRRRESRELWRTAVHEAGHALASLLALGVAPKLTSVLGGPTTLGRMHYADDAPLPRFVGRAPLRAAADVDDNLARVFRFGTLLARLVVAFAGHAAEAELLPGPTSHSCVDMNVADDDVAAARGEPLTAADHAADEALLAFGEADARVLMAAHRRQLVRLARALRDCGQLDAEQVQRIVASTTDADPTDLPDDSDDDARQAVRVRRVRIAADEDVPEEVVRQRCRRCRRGA